MWTSSVASSTTMSITSAGAFNANGFMTAMTAPRVWTIADPSVAEIRRQLPLGDVLLGALRPGTTSISAVIGDVEGSAMLRVIPRLAPITFTPEDHRPTNRVRVYSMNEFGKFQFEDEISVQLQRDWMGW